MDPLVLCSFQIKQRFSIALSQASLALIMLTEKMHKYLQNQTRFIRYTKLDLLLTTIYFDSVFI